MTTPGRLVPSSSPVAVAVVCSTDQMLESGSAHAIRLSAAERSRLSRIGSPAARHDYVAAHLLARVVVGAVTGRRAEQVALTQRCPSCGGRDHGKPSVATGAPTAVTWSHTDGVVAAAAGPGAIGIDIERESTFRPSPRLVARVLGPADAAVVAEADHPRRAFLQRWAVRESFVKVGIGGLTGAWPEGDARRQAMVHETFVHADLDVVGAWVSSEPVVMSTLEAVIEGEGVPGR